MSLSDGVAWEKENPVPVITEPVKAPAPGMQPRELTVILREIADNPDKYTLSQHVVNWIRIAAKELDDLVAEVKQLRACKRQLIDHQIILAELTMRLDTLKEQGRINTTSVAELYAAANEGAKECGTWEPIPKDVYWNAGLKYFYHTRGHHMSEAFFKKWAGRKHEFPGVMEIPNTSADLRPCDARVPDPEAPVTLDIADVMAFAQAAHESRDSVPATGGMSGDQHESPMDEALKEFNETTVAPEQRRTCQMCGLMIHRNSTVPVCGSCYPRYQVIQSLPKPVTEVS